MKTTQQFIVRAHQALEVSWSTDSNLQLPVWSQTASPLACLAEVRLQMYLECWGSIFPHHLLGSCHYLSCWIFWRTCSCLWPESQLLSCPIMVCYVQQLESTLTKSSLKTTILACKHHQLCSVSSLRLSPDPCPPQHLGWLWRWKRRDSGSGPSSS